MESLEGKRGLVRFEPPLPAVKGLFGLPTVINNVISLASMPIIRDQGSQYHPDFGRGRSRGTLPIQLGGNIERPGLIEKAFGITLRELLYDCGGGSATGRPIRAVTVDEPLGSWGHGFFGTKPRQRLRRTSKETRVRPKGALRRPVYRNAALGRVGLYRGLA